MFDTTIVPKESANSLIEAYQRNVQRLIAGYDLLIEADRDKERVFGGQRLSTYYSIFESDKEKALLNLRVSAWQAIVNNLGLHKVMSLKRSRAFEENCQQGKLPEINTENVYRFLDDVMANAHDIALESVQEVYDWLRPGAYRYDPYKTNAKNARWKLGKKVILRAILDVQYGGRWRVNMYQQDRMRQLDRMMHLLDGAGIPDGYLSPLLDAIHTTVYPQQSGETDYFSFKCFFNGNLHLTFKRLDLVERLNATAGGRNALGDGCP
jgi:hypothetical protein